MEEEVSASIVIFLILFGVVIPREEWEERLCLPVVVDNIIGVEVRGHK